MFTSGLDRCQTTSSNNFKDHLLVLHEPSGREGTLLHICGTAPSPSPNQSSSAFGRNLFSRSSMCVMAAGLGSTKIIRAISAEAATALVIRANKKLQGLLP